MTRLALRGLAGKVNVCHANSIRVEGTSRHAIQRRTAGPSVQTSIATHRATAKQVTQPTTWLARQLEDSAGAASVRDPRVMLFIYITS